MARVVLAHQLHMAPHDRQRGAQLVPGVVDEPALRGERDPEPVQHLVERGREVVQLVPQQRVRGVPDRDATAQVGLRDLVGGLAHHADRGQRPPGQHPTQDRRGDQRDPCHREGDQPGLADRVELAVGEDGHHVRSGRLLVAHLDRRDGEPHRATVRGVRTVDGLLGAGHDLQELRVEVQPGGGCVVAAGTDLAVDDDEHGLAGVRQAALQVQVEQVGHIGEGPPGGRIPALLCQQPQLGHLPPQFLGHRGSTCRRSSAWLATTVRARTVSTSSSTQPTSRACNGRPG